MGDIPYITTLCLNGTLSCVDFMDVIMGDIPYMGHFHKNVPVTVKTILKKKFFCFWQKSDESPSFQ